MTTEAVLQPQMMCVRVIKPLPSILVLRHQLNGSKLQRFIKSYEPTTRDKYLRAANSIQRTYSETTIACQEGYLKYIEAIEVTSELAITNGGDRSAEQRFYELYYGEMNLIELRQKTKSYIEDGGGLTTSRIESAMVAFKNALTAIKSGEDSIPPTISLQQLAQKIKTECDVFLKQGD
jgi:hypothetical protein